MIVVFILSAPLMRAKGLCKLPDGRDLWGKLDLALVGKVMLSKSSMQFSADLRLCSFSVVWPETAQS